MSHFHINYLLNLRVIYFSDSVSLPEACVDNLVFHFCDLSSDSVSFLYLQPLTEMLVLNDKWVSYFEAERKSFFLF